MRGDIRVVDPATVAETEPVDGLVERSIFRVGGRQLLLVRVDGESAWHRRNGAVYGWVRSGHGQVVSEGTRADLEAGDFLRVTAGSDVRYIAGAEQLELLAVVDGDGVAEVAAPTSIPADDAPEVVSPDDLVQTVESPELTRETPFPDAEVLLLYVEAAGGAAAGWHHHDDNVYFGYAVDGPSETEYGPAGEEVARIEVGDCFHVPPQLVHRDTNPTDETHHGIIWLCGGEPWVVNVDGPPNAGPRSS